MEWRTRTCEFCRKSFPNEELQYVLRGRPNPILLCSECRNKHVVTKPKDIPSPNPKAAKIDYICDRCKFKFKFKPDGTYRLHCPYCGKSDKIRKDTIVSAQDIIRSSED